MSKKFNIIFTVLCTFWLVSCSGAGGDWYYNAANNDGYYEYYDEVTGETYSAIDETGFVDADLVSSSYLSLSTSTYAYTNVRRYITEYSSGYTYIPKDAIVIEEMINYFDYDFVNNTNEALASVLEINKCPWNEDTYLALVGLKAKEVVADERPNNYVFLVDVSGSMNSESKLGMFKKAFGYLADTLDDNDRISIVTYASGVKVIANGVKGSDRSKLLDKVNKLSASGSTYGEAGIQRAYDVAYENFINNGNNRIFITTDGDFNVGINNTDDLTNFISEKRNEGIYLSVIGVGSGNTRHDMMEKLAKCGDGNAYYMDSEEEAKRIFQDKFGALVNTVAKDTKAKITFNPSVVDKYRVIGYENNSLTEDEYESEYTDAGEISLGFSTIALYELKLNEEFTLDNVLSLEVKYLDVDKNENVILNSELTTLCNSSNDFLFASCVAELGLLLRQSAYMGDASFENLITRLNTCNLGDDEYKLEFKELVGLASEMDMFQDVYLD